MATLYVYHTIHILCPIYMFGICGFVDNMNVVLSQILLCMHY